MGTGERRSRIDMALANADWVRCFPNSKLFHLTQVGSDHCPMLFVADTEQAHCWKPFRFYFTWLSDNTCPDVIKKAWSSIVHGSPAHKVITRLKHTRILLAQWNREHFGDIHQQIQRIETELDLLQKQPSSDVAYAQIIHLNKELNKWNSIQHEFYKQK